MIRSEGSRKYIQNVSWLFAERMVRLGVVLVTGIYVARALGDTIFGQLNYATGFVGLFFALGAMGIDDILVRDLVKHPEKRDELLGTGAFIKLMGTVVMVLLAGIGTFVKDMDGLTASLVIVVASAELLRPFSVVDHWFMAQARSSEAVKVQMVQVITSAAVKLGLSWAVMNGQMAAEAALPWFAWIYVLENVVIAAGHVLMYRRHGGDWRRWRVTRAMSAHLLHQSWPMLIYGMSLYVQARIDQVMIKDLLGGGQGEKAAYAEVGQYSVALKMIEALGFLPVIVQKSLAPAITRAKVQDHALYADRLLNLYRLMFLLFLVTAVPLYFMAEPIIVLLYGEEFRPAGFLLSLFAIRLFFTNMGTGKSSFITNEGLFKYSLITALVGASINVGVNYMLIPTYKSIGAIWATIISFLVSIFLLDMFLSRTRANLVLMIKAMFSFWRFHRAN